MMIDPNDIDLASLPSVGLHQKCKLPKTPCIYFAIDGDNQIQYIGKSVNPRQRWASHHKYKAVSELLGVRIAYLHCEQSLLIEVERALIAWFNPPLNRSDFIGRPVGFSPINGEDGAMTKKNKAWSMTDDDWNWLESQPNQSEVIRKAIAFYRQSIEN